MQILSNSRFSDLIIGILALLATCAQAQTPPQIVPGTVNMFLDNRSANDVGVPSGLVFQFGADIAGGSAGVYLHAVSATGLVTNTVPCSPLTIEPNFCVNSTPYNSNDLDPWQLYFTRGTATTQATGPSMVGVSSLPFPTSVTMSGTGLTPTIAWQIPNGFTPNGFRIQIYDKNHILPNGAADTIYGATLANPSATSFTLPANIGLSTSGNYAINFEVIQTRNGLPPGNTSTYFSRSNSFFDFTPLTGSIPSDVQLPTIDTNGVYNFSVGNVGPTQIAFIDPKIAVGYKYSTGGVGPDFQSLLLPNIGGGNFTLSYTDAAGAHTVSLLHDQQYFFGSGGVSDFTVTGIDPAAGLNPTSGTAFVTGLTFASAGAFTGTMTPITVAVPEPASYLMMLLGLVGVGGARQMRRRPSH